MIAGSRPIKEAKRQAAVQFFLWSQCNNCSASEDSIATTCDGTVCCGCGDIVTVNEPSQAWNMKKCQKLHMDPLCTPGVESELFFALRATVSGIRADFENYYIWA